MSAYEGSVFNRKAPVSVNWGCPEKPMCPTWCLGWLLDSLWSFLGDVLCAVGPTSFRFPIEAIAGRSFLRTPLPKEPLPEPELERRATLGQVCLCLPGVQNHFSHGCFGPLGGLR